MDTCIEVGCGSAAPFLAGSTALKRIGVDHFPYNPPCATEFHLVSQEHPFPELHVAGATTIISCDDPNLLVELAWYAPMSDELWVDWAGPKFVTANPTLLRRPRIAREYLLQNGFEEVPSEERWLVFRRA